MSDIDKFLEYIDDNISTLHQEVPYGNATVVMCQPVSFAIPLDYDKLKKAAEDNGYEIISVVFIPFSKWPMRIYIRAVRNGTD